MSEYHLSVANLKTVFSNRDIELAIVLVSSKDIPRGGTDYPQSNFIRPKLISLSIKIASAATRSLHSVPIPGRSSCFENLLLNGNGNAGFRPTADQFHQSRPLLMQISHISVLLDTEPKSGMRPLFLN